MSDEKPSTTEALEAPPPISKDVFFAQVYAMVELFQRSIPTPLQGSAHRLDDWRIVGPAMLARSAGLLKSVGLLLWTARDLDAQVLTRSLLEHVVTFAWLAIDPEQHVKWWLVKDYRERKKLERALAQHGWQLDDDHLDEYREKYVDEVEVCEVPDLASLARKADQFWIPHLGRMIDNSYGFGSCYAGFFRHHSAVVHATPRSLAYVAMRTQPVKGAGDTDFELRTDPQLPPEAGAMVAPTLFALGLGVASRALGWPDYDAVERELTLREKEG